MFQMKDTDPHFLKKCSAVFECNTPSTTRQSHDIQPPRPTEGYHYS